MLREPAVTDLALFASFGGFIELHERRDQDAPGLRGQELVAVASAALEPRQASRSPKNIPSSYTTTRTRQ